MKKLMIYNLEFPEYINTLEIGEYRFNRISEYKKAFIGLQHKIREIGGEFSIESNTGTHQVTATAEVPDQEKSAILPWIKDSKFTQLQDILLFLTLFTGRNVFALSKGEEKYPIIQDPRKLFWGGQFQLSIRRDVKWKNKASGELLSEQEIRGKSKYCYNYLDFGLEKTINEVLETIASKEWQDTYGNGYFIFTFRQAMRQDNIEPSFLLCWTIWEHLFTLHNRQWLDDDSIEKTSGDKKIAFIMNKYLLVSINDKARKEIKRITRARNRLIHFGAIPENVDFKEMELFIRLTEQIMAIVLRLKPSNAFNSSERLNSLLTSQ